MKPPDLSGTPDTTGTGSTTGRHLVLLRDGAIDEGVKALEAAGLKVVVSPVNSPDVLREDEAGDATAIVYPTLGFVVVESEPGAIAQLTKAALDPNGPIQSIRPEMIIKSTSDDGFDDNGQSLPTPISRVSAAYLGGYCDATTTLANGLRRYSQVAAAATREVAEVAAAAINWDESQVTWGLQATKVNRSAFIGRGIRIAVFDTGLDFNVVTGPDGRQRVVYHPDFEGRTITTISFVRGVASAKDGNGHGTHCVGTACGALRPSVLPRYGVAYGTEIYVAKVLGDDEQGAEASVGQGLEWAINNGCHIVSISIGWARDLDRPFDQHTENIARRALGRGTLLIAAAGNNSQRPGNIQPVSGPADCPSIMAVAALKSSSPTAAFEVAPFSNRGLNADGGLVDIAAPGVNIYSSYLMPTGHARRNGTSQAAPHVAGIAALYAEANPGVRGRALWNLLVRNAKPLQLLTQDVGAGLVQAP